MIRVRIKRRRHWTLTVWCGPHDWNWWITRQGLRYYHYDDRIGF